MKKVLFTALILAAIWILSAQPRGLTSREIVLEDDISVVQPQSAIALPPAAGTANSQSIRDTWLTDFEEPLEIMLPAGEQLGVRFNALNASGETMCSMGEILPASVSAVLRSPSWVRAELRAKLAMLNPARQALYAGLVNDAQDPYVDEIAFCVATSSPEYLNSSFALPQLFEENAQWIYSIAAELPYVEILDTGSAAAGGDYWSTTRYWKKDASGQMQQLTVPREIYYWYLVQPKITDEIAAYIDPSIVENNTTHSNNIVPPPVGKFWRSYLYGYEQTGYPVLADTLTLCQSVFNRDGSPGDAVRAIIWWINQNMSFTSNAERPHQPVRIFAKRFGRCGEYADLTAAVSRLALIPCNNVSSISTDHTWNEFWEEGWVSWEPVNGYLNNPLVYENGWGKVFGSVFEERCDGLFTPVTERYSEGLATINIQVVDANLQPVDGARVVLAIFETTPRFDCQRYTDNNGMVSFAVGENRDYRARTETSFGLYPANPGTYAQLVASSVAGEVYDYQFQIALPLPQPAIEPIPLPPDPVTDFRFNAAFSAAAYDITGKALWDDIDNLGVQPKHYQTVVSPADARIMATDADNLLFYQIDNWCSAPLIVGPAANGSAVFDIPAATDWYMFVDNSHRHGNAVRLTGSVNLERWGTPVDDPQAPQLAPIQFSASPNPFSAQTTLQCKQASAGPLQLEIFNLRGQKLRAFELSPCAGESPQIGTHEFVWDGRTVSGQQLAAGIYLARLTAGDRTATLKLLLLK